MWYRILALITFVFFFESVLAQVEIRQAETISCGLDDTGLHNVVANVKSMPAQKNQNASRIQTNGAVFDVKYSGFTEEAKNAFQYAIDIWARTIKSDVTIRVFANWAFLDNVTTLAFVTPTEVKNFDGTPERDLWYPTALAEKLARKDINPTTEADIVATFNSRRTDWYFGTDGNCPSDKLDLVSVVLHELGHGLGFSGTFRVNDSKGYYGQTDGNSKIYDTYLKNGLNQFLLSFENGSLTLANQLTSNSVTFASPVARQLSSTSADPRIYAPNPYNSGSSISHVDESTYENTANALMTPFAEFGKVSHDCGPLVRGMFYEMGWINTVFQHDAFDDQEDLLGKKFVLGVFSDTVVQNATIKLKYSYNESPTINEVLLSPSAVPDYFEGEIPGPVTETTIKYYFEATDILGRTYRHPIDNTQVLSFYLGVDKINPSIVHTSPQEIIQFESNLNFVATVTDNIGIQNVLFEYQINDGSFSSTEMIKTAGNEYSLSLDLTSLDINQGDKINYRITATDVSSQSNTTIFPASGLSFVSVKSFAVKETFISTLDTDQKEFFGDFSITKPVGFTSGAIHSQHPYTKSDGLDGIDKSYVLLYPIKLKSQDSFLDFDEVVLVEPGIGTDHTSPDFGDYVIVEGTDDGGQTWKPLVPGYDARKFADWLNYYNSNINNGDSKAIGTLNYYKHNQINLLNTFSAGSEIYIRFRLYSDNKNSGWGWAIDNMRVQDIVLAADDLVYKSSLTEIFPNPTQGKFSLNGITPLAQIKVYNMIGQYCKDLDPANQVHDISDLPTGMFLLRVTNSDGTSQTLRLIRN